MAFTAGWEQLGTACLHPPFHPPILVHSNCICPRSQQLQPRAAPAMGPLIIDGLGLLSAAWAAGQGWERSGVRGEEGTLPAHP